MEKNAVKNINRLQNSNSEKTIFRNGKSLKGNPHNKHVFIKFLSLIIVTCFALSACSSAANNKIRIGVVQFANHKSLDNCHEGFLLGLEEAGFKDGENIEIDYQIAQADTALANQIAGSFASKNYNLIVGIATPTAQAAYNAARYKNIPVIFNAVTDPIKAGLQNPDGSNIKGVTGTSDILPIKSQLELIRTFLPQAKKLGILYSTSEANSLSSIKTYEELAPEFGLEIVTQAITSSQDVPLAAQRLISQVDALTNLTDNTVVQNLQTILDKTNEAKIPYFGSEEEQVLNGCIAAEGLDYIELGKITGRMAAEILSGKKAEEIPISISEESSPFYNSKVMKKLDIELPEAYKHAQDLAK